MANKSLIKKITGSREVLLAVILILLFIIVTILSPSFLTPKSLSDMLKNNAVTIIMSLGMLCVMPRLCHFIRNESSRNVVFISISGRFA